VTKIVDKYLISKDLQTQFFNQDFEALVSNSLDLILFNSLIKNRNPDEIISMNVEVTKYFKIQYYNYLFRFLNLDEIKKLLNESTEVTSLKSFNQMTSDQKFAFHLKFFELAWKKYKLPTEDPSVKKSIGKILNNHLNKIYKFRPSSFSVSQLPEDVAILFHSEKLSQPEIAKFSNHIDSDEYVKRFKETKDHYRSLTKSFKLGDNLNKLHTLFVELSGYPLIHPEYPILPEHLRNFVPSDLDTAEFLKEPSPENLSSLVDMGLIKDGLEELVAFLSSFYKESSREYAGYQKIILPNYPSYDKIRTFFPDTNLPEVLNVNKPLQMSC
jgi:hypothetical protein